MEYRERLRTAVMATLLQAFDRHDLHTTAGGMVQVTPERLEIDQPHKELNATGGVDEWIYTTTVEVSVLRRRVH